MPPMVIKLPALEETMNRPTMLLLVAALLVPSGMAQNKYVDDVLALNPLGYWRLNGNTSNNGAPVYRG
jgi:hypothetical protein